MEHEFSSPSRREGPQPSRPGRLIERTISPEELGTSRFLTSFPAADRAEFATLLDRVVFESGELVVREGDRGSEMYIVLSGRAILQRKTIDLRPILAGDSFGELGLVGDHPRAATVIAATRLELARLSRERYDELVDERHRLATRVLQGLVVRLGDELVSMTDSVGVLLSQRSLPRQTHVEVTRGAHAETWPMGTELEQILPVEVDGALVVAGLIEQKPTSLDTPVFADVSVDTLSTARWEGREIYRRSVGLLLLAAAKEIAPELGVRIAASVSSAHVIELEPLPPPGFAERLEEAMRGLVRAGTPLREWMWTVEAARAKFLEQNWKAAADLLRIWRNPIVRLVSCGHVHALSPGPLLPTAGHIRDFSLRMRDHSLLLDFGDTIRSRLAPLEPELAAAMERELPVPPYGGDMVRDHRAWLRAMGVSSAGAFNDLCISGQVSQLTRVSEGFHEKRLGSLADVIASQDPPLRIICIAGPSSSGKTTFIRRLKVQLLVNGINPVEMSLDDYYVDRERTVRDERGEYDFEAFEAIDVELLQQHVRRLLAGARVKTAHYDFKTGKSHPDGGPELSVGHGDVLMLEGIHGLNPRLLGDQVDDDLVFRIFVHPATALPFDRLTRTSTADVRLLRRIVRDRHSRGYKAADTILRWPSVRRGERIHIFPYLPFADAVFDTSLVYEISVLKVFADRYLLEVPSGHPAYTTAYRLRHLIDRFVTIYPDHVPPTSILREFIGGSGFEY